MVSSDKIFSLRVQTSVSEVRLDDIFNIEHQLYKILTLEMKMLLCWSAINLQWILFDQIHLIVNSLYLHIVVLKNEWKMFSIRHATNVYQVLEWKLFSNR